MDQLDLFAKPPRAAGAAAERLAREHAAAERIARRLPPGVRFGTSSWSFPGWEGIVYPRRASTSDLAREGLADYSRHPLLTTVGIDRSFYAPIPERDLERYAEQLPAGFPCCAKAPQAVTSAYLDGRANPDFLSARRFVEETLAPFEKFFRDHVGPFVVQVPPAPTGRGPTPREFAERLDRFLAALPPSFGYAVELREESLLTPEYARVLAARGAGHVYNFAGSMPMPLGQAAVVPIDTAPFAVVRLLMRPGSRYDDRREEFLPFDRIVEPEPAMRSQIIALARAAVSTGRPVSILVNNKAEGCAPLTIRALAELLSEEEVSSPPAGS